MLPMQFLWTQAEELQEEPSVRSVFFQALYDGLR